MKIILGGKNMGKDQIKLNWKHRNERKREGKEGKN